MTINEREYFAVEERHDEQPERRSLLWLSSSTLAQP